MAKSDDIYGQGSYVMFGKASVARVGGDFDVAFFGTVSGPSGGTGIFVDRNVTTQLAAPETAFLSGSTLSLPPPFNQPVVDDIDAAAPPAISSGGFVAHTMTVDQVTPVLNDVQVLVRYGPTVGTYTLVSYAGKELDPSQPGDPIGVAAIPFGLSPTGEVGFRATLTAVPGHTAMLRYGSGGVLQVVARTGQAEPDGNGDYVLIAGQTNNEYIADFNSMSRSAFRATTTTGIGVWLDTGPGLIKVADKSTPPDGTPLPFLDFEAPAVGDPGMVAFRACLSTNCQTSGVWATGPLGLKKVAASSDSAPDELGASTTDQFLIFSNPVVNAGSDLAFQATLNLGATQGIWVRSGSGSGMLKRLVDTGTPLRGTNFTFQSFGADLVIADSGQVAFTATMSNGEIGLFATSEVGTIVKIVMIDDAFPLPGVGFKTIDYIGFHPGSAAQGNTGFVHNNLTLPQRAAIVYRLHFSGAAPNEAVVLTTLE